MSNYTLQQNNVSRNEEPQRSNPLLWGALLIGAGALLLLRQVGLFEGIAGFVWALLFAGGGLAFGYLAMSDFDHRWWAAIPAGALFGLAGTIMLGEYAPGRMQDLAGAAFFGGFSLGFWAIYLVRRDFWWAMIPGGVLLSLSGVVAVDQSTLGTAIDAGSVLFFGMGLTFLLVALTSTDEGNSRWWAYIPAGVLLLMGFVIFTQSASALTWLSILWPVALILVGGLLLLKALMDRRSQ
jgi:uncharacterized membrane protein HdeD (DUF308 family)